MANQSIKVLLYDPCCEQLFFNTAALHNDVSSRQRYRANLRTWRDVIIYHVVDLERCEF